MPKGTGIAHDSTAVPGHFDVCVASIAWIFVNTLFAVLILLRNPILYHRQVKNIQ